MKLNPSTNKKRQAILRLSFWSASATRILVFCYTRSIFSPSDGCVVRISDGERSILLSADIERQAEQRLVALESEGLASTLLVSPHHGSRSSSTPPFVTAVAAREVVHSAGFRNQWNFPRPEVVARYRDARQWITGQQGAILVEPTAEGLRVTAERDGGPWYRRSGDWWRPKRWFGQ